MKATTMLVLGGLLSAGTAIAAEPQQAPSAESGMKVGIDPKTGKLRPLNAAESAKLDAVAAKNRQVVAGKSRTTLAKQDVSTYTVDGMEVTVHGDAFMTDVQARVGADGRVVVSHEGQVVQGATAPQEASDE